MAQRAECREVDDPRPVATFVMLVGFLPISAANTVEGLAFLINKQENATTR